MYTFSLPDQQSSIEIQIINDTILEEKEEEFLVGFSFLTDFVPVLSSQEQAIVTIFDDDSEFTHDSIKLALRHHNNTIAMSAVGRLLCVLSLIPFTLLSDISSIGFEYTNTLLTKMYLKLAQFNVVCCKVLLMKNSPNQTTYRLRTCCSSLLHEYHIHNN